MKKRFTSFILSLVLVLSCCPISLAVAADVCTISVENTFAKPGSTVEIDINIENNPGILSAAFSINYDEKLTLIDSKNGSVFSEYAFTLPNRYNNGCRFVWQGNEVKTVSDGTILTLTFRVAADVDEFETLEINATYNSYDILDENLNSVPLSVNKGGIMVASFRPGDVNDDGIINTLDLIWFAKYISDNYTTDPDGYNITLNQAAANVNGDTIVSMADLILISRYFSDDCVTDPDGYNVTLIPSTLTCNHQMTATAEIAATCTKAGNIAYWQCSLCDKYFSDAEATQQITREDTVVLANHTLTFVQQKDPTINEEGNREYWSCSVCEKLFSDAEGIKEVSLSDVVIGKISATAHKITYNLTNNDSYLENNINSIKNTNPVVFYEEEELILEDAEMQGYNFEGWYDGTGSNANRVTKIAIGTTHDITLYARWVISENSKYTVYFVSEGAACDVIYNGEKVSKITKNMNEQLILPSPAMQGYIFLCWTDGDGNIVTSIEPGSHGEITVSAHWTSERNQAKPVKELGAPLVVEDEKEGKIHFIYELGDIINVPLEVLENYGNVDRLERESKTVSSKTVTSVTAKTIAETVANMTSKSSSITLSEDWNENVSVSEEQSSDISQENIDVIIDRVENGGEWNISKSNGGSTEYSVTSGESESSSKKNTTAAVHSNNMTLKKTSESGFSGEINVGSSSKASTEKRQDFNIGLNIGIGASVKVPTDDGVDLGASSTRGLNLGYSNGRTTYTENSSHQDITIGVSQKEGKEVSFDVSASSSLGTENSKEKKQYTDLTSSTTNTWNSEESFTTSNKDAHEESYTTAIAKAIGEKFGYSTSSGQSFGKSDTASSLEENEKTNEYVSTVEYSTEEKTEEMTSAKVYKDYAGYHRLVEAGTLHVFGIVSYDIAKGAYNTSTYSILDPETVPFYDYSIDGTYKDRENGIIPFEIPFFVNRYVSANMAYTEGLIIEPETGDVHAYEGDSKNVMLPNYYSVDEGDETRSAIKVTEFLPGAFANNKHIETVMLSDFITAIPDGAFAGCTNLKTVIAPGVISIGANAFSGCTSLDKFNVTSKVGFIGENAFEGVNEIVVYAQNSTVAKSVINSGAAKISLYFADMVDTLSNYTIETGKNTTFFALYGAGKTFENVKVISKAEETKLNRATFNVESDIALDISSSKLILNQLNASSGVIALLLRSPNTQIDIERTSIFTSSIGNAVVANDVSITKTTSYAAYLKTEGNMYINGNTDFIGKNIVSPPENCSILGIDSKQYLAMTDKVTVKFNSNEGTAVNEQKVYYGTKLTEPSAPSKDHHAFLGWFEDEALTKEFNFDKAITSNMALYAKWKLNEFTVTFNPNGGSVSPTSKTLIFGKTFGTLPTPVRDGFTFLGWFVDDVNAECITEGSLYTWENDITVRAHWRSNEFVDPSQVPANAIIVEAKWTYDLKTTISSDKPFIEGYTFSHMGEYGEWSEWSKTMAIESDSKDVETKTVIDYYTYDYMRYRNKVTLANGTAPTWYTVETLCGAKKETNLDANNFEEEWERGELTPRKIVGTWTCPCGCGKYGNEYEDDKINEYGQMHPMYYEVKNPVTHMEYRYRDRVYHHFKTEAKESLSEVTPSDTISNVKKLVRYIEM